MSYVTTLHPQKEWNEVLFCFVPPIFFGVVFGGVGGTVCFGPYVVGWLSVG